MYLWMNAKQVSSASKLEKIYAHNFSIEFFHCNDLIWQTNWF